MPVNGGVAPLDCAVMFFVPERPRFCIVVMRFRLRQNSAFQTGRIAVDSRLSAELYLHTVREGTEYQSKSGETNWHAVLMCEKRLLGRDLSEKVRTALASLRN